MNDKEMINKAKNCSTCSEWLSCCDAECCKIIPLNIEDHQIDTTPGYLVMHLAKAATPSEQWYWKLRGVKYSRGVLKFDKTEIKKVHGEWCHVRDCGYLVDNKCKGHPDNKPEVCRQLTYENAKKGGQAFQLTKRCLFKYK